MSSWTSKGAYSLLVATLFFVACTPSCHSEDHVASGAGSGGASSSHSSGVVIPSYVNASSGTDGGGGCSHDYPDPGAGVPTGWIRPPGSPCDCDVYISPDQQHMKAASPWKSCGDGCSELVRDWSDDTVYTFGAVMGTASSNAKWIAYKRYLKAGGPNEFQVVRLPENKVVFDEFEFSDIHANWSTSPRRLTSPKGLLEIWQSLVDNSGHKSLLYVLDLDDPMPHLSFAATVGWHAYEAAISPDLWAMTFQPPYSWKWHASSAANELQLGYQIGGGALFGLETVGSNLFFSVWLGGKASDIMVFDPVGGNRTLVTFPSKTVGGACCLLTDGKDMTWLQGADLVGDDTYAAVNLMAAPFATSVAELKPHVVRPAFQKSVIAGGGAIGGGYALYSEAANGQVRKILTRLSDGYYWVVAPRQGRDWSQILYVDSEEFAMVEELVGKFTYGSWTIVRRSIASLGPPRPPGSGFDP